MIFDFVNGSLLGAAISTIFYPFNVLKSHMQARIGGKHLTIKETFWLVYESRERNVTRLYKGVGGNFLRAIFAWGITNSAYEFSLDKLKHLRNFEVYSIKDQFRVVLLRLVSFNYHKPFTKTLRYAVRVLSFEHSSGFIKCSLQKAEFNLAFFV
ncbi:solute carrier family 25 member 51-like [Brachionus plicatilis]|uniref:Solute carrier family 25 member 51-like n=1 Tax=Brachionus plicatilis TaxID=10195 RepID=A0A3M7T1H6_BRAPC|nr:solute carrier family 25 member 51-like [Brachionus plicatilis]